MQSRKLDFRVWDKEHSKFMVMDLDSELSITFNGHLMESYIDGYCLHNKDTYVIQQWTGLVDINDVKIYEGDIVKSRQESNSKESVGEIVWHHSYWALAGYKLFIFDDDTTDIIGNIFENPELLKA